MNFRSLLKISALTGLIRIIGLILEFCVIVLLTKNMSVSNYGVFASIYAAIRLLSVIAQFGFPSIAVRFTAQYVSGLQWGLFKGFIRKSNLIMAFASFLVILLYILINASGVTGIVDSSSGYMALSLIPLLAFNNFRSAILRGLKHVAIGQLPDLIIRPIFIIICTSAYIFIINEDLKTFDVMVIFSLSYALTYIVGSIFLLKKLPIECKDVVDLYATKVWMKSGFPAMISMLVMSLNTQLPIIFLTFTAPIELVGIYSAVSQLGLALAMSSTIINIAVAPHIAEYFSKNKHADLKKLSEKAKFILIALNAMGAFIFIKFGIDVLNIFFGEAYMVGADALSIIAIGNLVGSISGISMIYLNVTGRETKVLYAQIISALVLILSLISWTHHEVLVNVAFSVFISIFILNLSLLYFAKSIGPRCS